MRAYRAFLPENKMRTEPQNTLQNRPLRRSKKLDESTTYMMCDLPLVPGSNPGGPTNSARVQPGDMGNILYRLHG
jgi:hypothetical protein